MRLKIEGSTVTQTTSPRCEYQSRSISTLQPLATKYNTALHNGTQPLPRQPSPVIIKAMRDTNCWQIASSRTPHSGARPPDARGAQERRDAKRTPGYVRYVDESHFEGSRADEPCMFSFSLRSILAQGNLSPQCCPVCTRC